MRNLFCRSEDLDSEADVEILVIERLLTKLGFPDDRVRRKDSLDSIRVARGRERVLFKPDYVLHDRLNRPSIVIEAKAPRETPDNFHYQVSGYALGLNQRYDDGNPVRYIVVTNGLSLTLWNWDSLSPSLQMTFRDFEEDNEKFLLLRATLSYSALDVDRVTKGVFPFKRPDLNELIRTFNDCHDIIWKKEGHGPTDAFYEFAKLIFVKLREDKRIITEIEKGKQVGPSDFNFSAHWIREQIDRMVSDNPVSDLLFKKVLVDLEEQIKRGEKKRIFEIGDSLKLSTDTVLQVVEKLENYDLHGIDEDLNGRMFETFLNATVRGKELGQFFTPRSVVKYMCNSAHLLHVKGDFLPYILDGCCGSGGFLIDAMAVLVHAIDARDDLNQKRKQSLKQNLFKDHLFGVDKAEKIARIARLNMYLHGDGGSTIYTTDMLDKTLQTPAGLSSEIGSDLEELRKHFIDEGKKFDIILSNPPFSMTYNAKNQDEKRILQQYEIATTGRGALSQNAKSNVLFLERFCDCLKKGGELLTVIDNTILNGIGSQRYRDYILENFIILQIVALPFNTFFRAQANVQTSIIHLRKREGEDDEQDIVFMAILNNVGHDDHQHFTPNRDNTPRLKEVYKDWSETGEITEVFEPNVGENENLGCPFQTFTVSPDQLNKNRLDAFYYAPELRKAQRKMLGNPDIEIRKGSEFNIVPAMSSQEVSECRNSVFRYFEIGDVTRDGSIVNYRENRLRDLPLRARIRVQTNDVLLAKNNSSRGTTVIVSREFNNQLVTTGFIALRPENEEEALLLWSILKSEFFRRQVYYLGITAVQPEIRDEIFRDEIILPIPRHKKGKEELISGARSVRELYEGVRSALARTHEATRKLYE